MTAYSYFFGALFMGLASIYYAASQQFDKFVIPQTVSNLNTAKLCDYYLVFPLQSAYALVYAIFITSAACYLLVTWSNMHLPTTIVTAFWPLQVHKLLAVASADNSLLTAAGSGNSVSIVLHHW